MHPNSRDLQKTIEEIFDFAYTNSNIKIPAKTCKEVGKILHVGMFIEEIEKKIPAYSFNNDELKNLNGNKTLFSESTAILIKEKFKSMNSEWNIYGDEINFDNNCISYIAGQLNNLYISDKNRDVFGDTLEIFRSKWAKQEGGQFFTDQKVTSLAIKLLQYNPYKKDDLVDICAGTGGFLLAGFNRIKELVDEKNGTEKDVLSLAAKSLIGQEIDKEVAALGNSTLMSRTGNYVDKFIQSGNSLDCSTFENSKKISFNTHLCAVTNPPFGAKITIKDSQILKEYQLAKLTNKNLNNQTSTNIYRRSPDILFIEQNIKLLKPGKGRLAIVVPYQIISGPQTLYIRNWIICNSQILSVIDLPSETFQPHTGTKTALLILKRRKTPLKNIKKATEEKIFMSSPRWIGHDRRGNPVYKKNIDGSESNEILSDFDQVENSFNEHLKGIDPSINHENSFTIKTEKIINDELLRFNALFHKPSGKTEDNTLLDDSWEVKPISELVERIFYPGRFKRNYVDKYNKSIPFLGGSNITQLIISTEKWIRHDDPNLEKLAVKEGWVLITRSGTTGIVSSVPASWNGFAMSEHVIRIIPDNDKLSKNYLIAFLKTKYCQQQIAKGVFGSVIDEITPESIGKIKIPIPKNKTIYENICSKIEKAENSKQVSIENLYGAIEQLSALLPN